MYDKHFQEILNKKMVKFSIATWLGKEEESKKKYWTCFFYRNVSGNVRVTNAKVDTKHKMIWYVETEKKYNYEDPHLTTKALNWKKFSPVSIYIYVSHIHLVTKFFFFK